MEWSEENTLRFIDLYKNKEVLWNAKHPSHFNRVRRNDAWEEVASELKINVKACKKKMDVLLSSLRREKAKIKKSERTRKGM